MRRILVIILFSLSPLFLTGCGEEVCILGFGDCDELTGDLTLSSGTSVVVGSTLLFTASGGTLPYAFALIAGTGSLAPTDTDATFTASEAGNICVRVTDGTGKTDDRCVTVTAS